MQTQIKEREDGIPFAKRIGEIFKKYGVTVTAVLISSGITIGAVIRVTGNAMEKIGKGIRDTGKSIGDDLKKKTGKSI